MCAMFFFNDTATTEIYTLSLHDALPIWPERVGVRQHAERCADPPHRHPQRRIARVPEEQDPPPAVARLHAPEDRKSTRLNSSHANISYAVFCLKKKKTQCSPAPYELPPL